MQMHFFVCAKIVFLAMQEMQFDEEFGFSCLSASRQGGSEKKSKMKRRKWNDDIWNYGVNCSYEI